MECHDSPLEDIYSDEFIHRMNNGVISRRVLLPDNILLHPEVFHARIFYRDSFLRSVISALPAQMQGDLNAIENLTGSGLNIQIVSNGILHRGKKISFSRFDIGSDPEDGILEVSFDEKAGMAITGSQNHDEFVLEESGEVGRDLFHNLKGDQTFKKICHPMFAGSLADARSQKVGSYICESCSKEKSDRYFHVWYIEGLRQAILPFRHFCRNFAILVNNLGLEQIRKSRASRIIF